VFTASDAPRPSEQITPTENSKQLVTLKDLQDFHAGQAKFQGSTAFSNLSDLNPYQTAEIRQTQKAESQSVENMLSNFSVTKNTVDRPTEQAKPALADTIAPLSHEELTKLLKSLHFEQASDPLADLIKELSTNDSRTGHDTNQHRDGHGTDHQNAQHHRHAYSTLEGEAAEQHRDLRGDRREQHHESRGDHHEQHHESRGDRREQHHESRGDHHEQHEQNHERHANPEVHKWHPEVRTHNEPTIDQNRFAEAAKHLIAKIGHNGEVTLPELVKAVQDHRITGQDAQVLAGLYHSFNHLNNLSGHDRLNDVISTADLDRYQQVKAQTDKDLVELPKLGQWASNNLGRFSSDGHSVSQHDIQNALSNPHSSAADKQMLHEIQQHWSGMTNATHPTITGKDVQTYVNNFSQSDNVTMIADVISACDVTSFHGQRAQICYDLYKGDALDSIRHGDVKQGLSGDCYFEAVVSGLARSNPQAIKDMIHNNGDGTYSVKFPGMAAGEAPIKVAAPTETELGLYNGGSKYGTWATVLEKAYGQWRENHETKHPAETPEDGANGGGNPCSVLQLLTGKTASEMNVSKATEVSMANTLQTAFASKPPLVVAASIDGGPGPDTTPDGLPRDHSYTVIGTHKEHGQLMVDIRNPWGDDVKGPRGTFSLPLSQFMKDFNRVEIQGQ